MFGSDVSMFSDRTLHPVMLFMFRTNSVLKIVKVMSHENMTSLFITETDRNQKIITFKTLRSGNLDQTS